MSDNSRYQTLVYDTYIILGEYISFIYNKWYTDVPWNHGPVPVWFWHIMARWKGYVRVNALDMPCQKLRMNAKLVQKTPVHLFIDNLCANINMRISMIRTLS